MYIQIYMYMKKKKSDGVVNLVSGGSVINKGKPSSLQTNCKNLILLNKEEEEEEKKHSYYMQKDIVEYGELSK